MTALTNEELKGLWFQLRVIWAKGFCRKSLHFPELFNDIDQIIPDGRRPVDVVGCIDYKSLVPQTALSCTRTYQT